MSESLRYYSERFRALPETARLLAMVVALGLCSLYVLGLVSLIAGPRLRQAPVAYAEVVYVTSTPTDTPTPLPTDTPRPTDTPAPTAGPAPIAARLLMVEPPDAPTVEATPTQRSAQPSPTATVPRVEATPTRAKAIPVASQPKKRLTPTRTPRRR